jgi:hypothetical protein
MTEDRAASIVCWYFRVVRFFGSLLGIHVWMLCKICGATLSMDNPQSMLAHEKSCWEEENQ